MKELENPTTDFNMQLPTYVEAAKVIMKMKSSVSPCPLDQISVIAFKKSPVLRSLLANILQTAWTAKTFPDVWKSEVSLLAYKKGDAGNPENVRPITLQPVLSKVFTSIIRNRLFNFASKNKYIETNLQKGFWEKISGCIEHIECLLHIINNAKLKQRGCVVTLLDLKNP